MRAAVDIGGTFTDVLIHNESKGEFFAAKVHSNPIDPAVAFIEGIGQALALSGSVSDNLCEFLHGTTIVTNALLEGKTAKVGLLVTEGFRDLLEIGRQQRQSLYDLQQEKIKTFVPRDLVLQVRERIAANGQIITELDEDHACDQIRALRDSRIETLAAVLLFSFANDRHERRLKELADKLLPDTKIFISSEILPEFREYERASTTVIAASVAPKVASYLQSINQKLVERGWIADDLLIMHSGGGMLTTDEAIERPHTLIESGPAAGIIAAGYLSNTLGLGRVIAFDMGGTTAKAGLVLDGVPQYTTEYEVGGSVQHSGRVKGSGYPVRFPMIDIVECGAGAGSIAWIDKGGHLKVGPESAGANPGPACYGRGGKSPTVTDANLALGRLDPNAFLGGEMTLFPELGLGAIKKKVCDALGLGVEDAATGIIALASANMLRILRLVSVEKGYDPREFTLIAYGGAGPLHATELAEEIAIRRIVVPHQPGLFSALGLILADRMVDFLEMMMLPLTVDSLTELNASLELLHDRAASWFERNVDSRDHKALIVQADARYRGQNYELCLPLPRISLTPDDILCIQRSFHQLHDQVYGHHAPEEEIEVVILRLRAIKRTLKPRRVTIDSLEGKATAIPVCSRKVWFPDGSRLCSVYRRDALGVDQQIEGPAIINEDFATTLVSPGWKAHLDRFGNLIIDR